MFGEDITRKLIQGAGGEYLAAFDAAGRMVGRATDPEAQYQTNIPVTQFVVGQESPIGSIADRIFRPILETKIAFAYDTWGTEHLQRQITARGPSGAYEHSAPVVTRQTAATKRHSWSARQDIDGLNNADPSFGLAVKMARWGQRIVQLTLEYEARDLLLTTGSYAASHTLAIGAGSEWNDATPGDMLGVVRTAMAQITGATNLQPQDLEAYISPNGLTAALANSDFRTARQYTQGPGYPSINQLADYLGFAPGKLWTQNLIGREIGSVTPTALYNDVMIIYAPGDEGNYDREYGSHRFAARFSPNDGVAGSAFYQNEITSWVWPFDRRWHLGIVNNNAAYLITNLST